eukprot:jgi/Chlat1/187/Chrsp1S03109
MAAATPAAAADGGDGGFLGGCTVRLSFTPGRFVWGGSSDRARAPPLPTAVRASLWVCSTSSLSPSAAAGSWVESDPAPVAPDGTFHILLRHTWQVDTGWHGIRQLVEEPLIVALQYAKAGGTWSGSLGKASVSLAGLVTQSESRLMCPISLSSPTEWLVELQAVLVTSQNVSSQMTNAFVLDISVTSAQPLPPAVYMQATTSPRSYLISLCLPARMNKPAVLADGRLDFESGCVAWKTPMYILLTPAEASDLLAEVKAGATLLFELGSYARDHEHDSDARKDFADAVYYGVAKMSLEGLLEPGQTSTVSQCPLEAYHSLDPTPTSVAGKSPLSRDESSPTASSAWEAAGCSLSIEVSTSRALVALKEVREGPPRLAPAGDFASGDLDESDIWGEEATSFTRKDAEYSSDEEEASVSHAEDGDDYVSDHVYMSRASLKQNSAFPFRDKQPDIIPRPSSRGPLPPAGPTLSRNPSARSQVSALTAVSPGTQALPWGVPQRGPSPVPAEVPNWIQSAPVAVPRSLTRAWQKVDLNNDSDEEHPFGQKAKAVGFSNGFVPPHVLLAMQEVGQRGGAMTYAAKGGLMEPGSVVEGVGCTLKGQAARRIRNAVLRQTGFLD